MKRILCLFMVLVTLLMCSCGSKSNNEGNNESNKENNVAKHNLGDMVSSDIAEVTVKKAALAYYAESPNTSVSSGETTNVSEACAPTDNTVAFFKSNKGTALVCLDFVLKNIDRDTLESSVVSFSVKQNGESSAVKGYDLNNKEGFGELNLSSATIAYGETEDFYTNKTSYVLIHANETIEIKAVGVIGFDAKLDEPFDLIVQIENSDGETEEFVYSIK